MVWRVHEIESQQIINVETLKQQYNIGEVGALNFGDVIVEELLVESSVGVEPETLSL